MPIRTPSLMLLAGSIMAAAVSLTVLDAAQQRSNVRLSGLDPGLPVTVLEDGAGAIKAATGAAGDLDIALDPKKHYVLYRRDCTRYEIVVEGSAADDACRKAIADSPQQPGEKCGRCVRVGTIFGGTFTASGMAQQAPTSGGSHTLRNTLIGTSLALGGGAFFVARDGDPKSPNASTPALTTFAGLSFQNSLSKTSDTCGTFGNPAIIRLRLATVNADGSAFVEIIHVSANNTTFSGPGTLARQADGGYSLAAANAQTGTLISTGQGVVNGAGTMISSFRTVVSRADGSCGATYDGTLPRQ